jgi:hypothetical protein
MMLHSPKIMSHMMSRKPDEENTDVGSVPAGATLVDKSRAAAAQDSQPIDAMHRIRDHAKRILTSHIQSQGGITLSAAADAWDAFHTARNSDDLAHRLQGLDLPNVTKHELYLAKKETDASPTWRDHIDRAVEVIHRVAALHKSSPGSRGTALDLAEKHPTVLGEVMKAVRAKKD